MHFSTCLFVKCYDIKILVCYYLNIFLFLNFRRTIALRHLEYDEVEAEIETTVENGVVKGEFLLVEGQYGC